ncbi:MAG: sugar ABC transporter ATP-binding protein [Nitriliruptorales bacterium]|nr:sugar ABC transporter ATP-binding protein [Nitriliruptorales bacterium]
MAAPALLEVRELVKEYPGVVALSGVDFDLHAGEVHCLVGQNGAGKSTLIKCVSGAVIPTRGQVFVEGEPVPPGNPLTSIDRGIGTIYQELDLVSDLTVAQNVFLGHERRGRILLDRRAMIEETRRLFERLEHPQIPATAPVSRLRPAAQQIVSIARALSRQVKVLIMDEPSAVLDDHEITALFAVVERLKQEGVGIIYISHRLDEVRRIGDRVTVLKDGATVATGLPADAPASELVAHMVGRPLSEMFPQREPEFGSPMLQVRNLTRTPDVQDVSFEVRTGEILGVAGLVGAGRTELLRAIVGLERIDGGSVHVDGAPLPPGRPDVAVERGVGLAPEERKSQGLLLGWPLVNNVSLADLGRFVRAGFIDRQSERAEAHEQLRVLDTQPDDPSRRAGELSGGNQQKVVLARWLLGHCKVLLLDEPTRGVDVGAKAEIYKVIAELAASGLAVVMVSSELPELVGFCDRILVMSDGRIVAEGGGDELSEADILDYCVNTKLVREAA